MIFRNLLKNLENSGLVADPFQFSNLLQLFNNQLYQDSIVFEKVNKGQLKMVNATIKNGRIALYCPFNEIIRGSGTSFQSSSLNQKHVGNVCNAAH